MKIIALVFVSGLFVLPGCRAETPPPQVQNADDHGVSAPVGAPAAIEAPARSASAEGTSLALDVLPMNEMNVYTHEKDPKIAARYREAVKIATERFKIRTEMHPYSQRLGDWFLLKFEVPDDYPKIPDIPTPRPEMYVVDLRAGKAIEPGDWRAAKPLFDALLEVYDRTEGEARKTGMLKHLASAASAVAFSHGDFLEVDEDSRFSKIADNPRLKRTMNGAELTYYIASTGMRLQITRCILRITDTAIAFESEITLDG